MKTNKPLVAKTNLKSKTRLRARTGLTGASKSTIPSLRNKADRLCARAVRIRDCEFIDGAWQGKCITCDRACTVVDANGKWQKSNGWGHFVGRGDFNLRYHPENVNLQCSHCNAWRDSGDMLEAYKQALDYKYGVGTWKKLRKEHRLNNRASLTKAEYEQVIHDAQAELDFYLANL